MAMIDVVIATCGSREWRDLAMSRALPSVAPGWEPTVVHLDGDATIAQARNYGASKGDAPWLCFLDADDELHPSYLFMMEQRIMGDPGDPFRLYAPAVMYVTRRSPFDIETTGPAIPNTHMTMPPLNHCVIGTLVARVVFDHVGGFREGYYPWEDYELWLRCISAGCVVQYVPEAIYCADVNPNSAHRSLSRPDAVRLASRIHREHRLRGAST